MDISSLQIVLIENLKEHWQSQDIRDLYCNLLQIKLKGYERVYGENVISADKADFFGTHLIVCQKGLRLKPIFGYKSVTFDKCEEFNCAFPALALVKSDAESECLNELNKILEKAKNNDKKISFDYSWAQDTSLKEIRSEDMANLFRDLAVMLAVNHHKDFNIDETITCGVLKVKTDLLFEKMGYKKISSKSLFPQKDLNGDLVHIFHTNDYSDYAKQVANNYQQLWDNRIEFSERKVSKTKLKLVA